MPGRQQKKPRVTRREKKALVASLVQAANVAEDIMNELKDLTVYRSESVDLKIEYQPSDKIDPEDMNQIFSLLKTNMEDLYEKSAWGWDETKKLNELTDEAARFLIAKNSDGKILGFTHFRFDVEVNQPILYCYELQVAEEIQRKGLGKYLMNILLLIAFKFRLVKIMLTVFTHNTQALDFYIKSLEFRRDETCPYEEEDKCYVILSKCLDKALINNIKSKLQIKGY